MNRYSLRKQNWRRRASSATDFFWIIAVIALLIAILLPSLSRAREITKRAVCASNLRGIGQGCLVYANDNANWWPHHPYAPPMAAPTDTHPRATVRWVGTMGSNDFLKITEPSTKSLDRNHPSRSLFMLIIDGTCTEKQFLCPNSADQDDDLRNYEGGTAVAAQCGVNRFDFAGYDRLSYGYQLPFGPKARPTSLLDARMVVLADKGPYYKKGADGLPGTRTTHDARSAVVAPTALGADGAKQLLTKAWDVWRPFNSRNHGGEGQNVLYVDGHAVFEKRPIVGVNFDNIYTVQTDRGLLDALVGMVPDADDTTSPLTNTDSFIVP